MSGNIRDNHSKTLLHKYFYDKLESVVDPLLFFHLKNLKETKVQLCQIRTETEDLHLTEQ